MYPRSSIGRESNGLLMREIESGGVEVSVCVPPRLSKDVRSSETLHHSGLQGYDSYGLTTLLATHSRIAGGRKFNGHMSLCPDNAAELARSRGTPITLGQLMACAGAALVAHNTTRRSYHALM